MLVQEPPQAETRAYSALPITNDLKLTSEWFAKKGIGLSKVNQKTSNNFNKESKPFQLELEINNVKISVPFELLRIYDEIISSKKILSLPENWDSEGAYSIETNIWERAAFFLVKYSKWILENNGIVIATPTISAVPDGSIDLLWHTSSVRMLINIKNTSKSEAHYYGDFYDNNTFKGSIELNDKIHRFFASCLSNVRD